jgi:predicted DNA-binding transcriptional regulator AlpA
MPKDYTMEEISLFGSVSWAAMRCGLSRENFKKKRPQLETDGFPRPDKITGTYLKADVDAWIERRRQVPDRIREVRADKPEEEFNFDRI